ncbi:MAG: VCBS repeat-containing protein, partial [Phycisphaerales bacterium]|nr:VCBS repeat-containing protein [Phycisphaerales bacterium]
WGDYDNDGDMDLWVSRRDSGQTGYLWRNDRDWDAGTGAFTNQASAAGLTDTTGQRGCCWGDYDNDGDLDLYIVTRGVGSSNVLYMNNGDGTFITQDVGAAAPGDGHDAVFVDYDNDGDLDLSVTQEDAGNTLLENLTDDDAFLKVRVLGAGKGKTNKAAVGVRVELWS